MFYFDNFYFVLFICHLGKIVMSFCSYYSSILKYIDIVMQRKLHTFNDHAKPGKCFMRNVFLYALYIFNPCNVFFLLIAFELKRLKKHRNALVERCGLLAIQVTRFSETVFHTSLIFTTIISHLPSLDSQKCV